MLDKITFHQKDLPSANMFKHSVAVDTEAMGLCHYRDRLCLVQLADEMGNIHLVQIEKEQKNAPNLVALMEDNSVQKIFHFARFDITVIKHRFGIDVNNIYCTKIASKMCRTFTSKHSLKDLCKDFLNIELLKEEQTSDWGAKELTDQQKLYAAKDVLYLHKIKSALDAMLKREGRVDLVKSCFDFLNTRATLDLLVNEKFDIFSHSSD
ncbi:MAG: ribonuclease D [Proteobacteria bacterium]|nr:ribonuclease D [Pseudomonadota bacterium]